MNAEQLRDAVDSVSSDIKVYNLAKLLSQVETSFAQSVQAPAGATAEAFDAAMKALQEAVAASACVRLSPSRIAILGKIGAADLCGTGLVEKVNSIISSAVTPAAAVQGLQDLRTRAQQFYQTATSLRDALAALEINGEGPPNDAAEVEVRLPFALFDRSLAGLAKEAKLLDRAVSDVVETVTGKRPPVLVRTVSAGSVEIFLTVDPVSGVAILGLVTGIVNLINSVLATRKTRLELERDQAPKEVLDPLAKWEQSRVAEELSKLRDELLAQSTLDKGRKNELKKALGDSLRYMADRIDRGMDIEVSTQLDGVPNDISGADGSTSDPSAKAQWQIARAMNTRRRLPRTGPPILELPALAEAEDDAEKPKEHGKPKA